MSYVALYRQYRPIDFEGLIGQEHIKKTLKNALKSKLAHAYLFSGPRGTGKTSMAKLIAKAVNCLNPNENGEPCNSCDNCVAANNGSMSDIYEIDAASNNGVDEIRNIRENVNFSPSQGKYKVYIIDEVHMLSIGAFNALLKTLEEPPAHIIFILATTEPHKIPMTIISRCQRFDFRRISPTDIVERMKYIVNDQKLKVEEGALQLIANVAQGGMRDALNLLDQAISYADDSVTEEDVTIIIGKTSIKFVGEVVELIEKGDISAALEKVEEIIENGKEPEYFIQDLIGYYRDLLLYQVTKNPENLNTALKDDTFIKLSKKVSKEDVQYKITELMDCQNRLKWGNSTRTIIEATLVKLIDNTDSTTNEHIINILIERISKMNKKLTQLEQKVNCDIAEDVSDIINKKILPYATKEYKKFIVYKYESIIHFLSKNKIILKDSKPVLCSKNYLVITFPTEDQVNVANQNKGIIEHAVEEVIGQPLQVVCITHEKWEEIAKEYVNRKKNSQEKKQAI